MKMIAFLSSVLIPLILFYVIGYGLLTKRDVYHDFLEGAGDGLKIVKDLIPTLIGLMTGVGVLRVRRRDFSGDRASGSCAAVFFQCGVRASFGYIQGIWNRFPDRIHSQFDTKLDGERILLYECLLWLRGGTEDKVYSGGGAYGHPCRDSGVCLSGRVFAVILEYFLK